MYRLEVESGGRSCLCRQGDTEPDDEDDVVGVVVVVVALDFSSPSSSTFSNPKYFDLLDCQLPPDFASDSAADCFVDEVSAESEVDAVLDLSESLCCSHCRMFGLLLLPVVLLLLPLPLLAFSSSVGVGVAELIVSSNLL